MTTLMNLQLQQPVICYSNYVSNRSLAATDRRGHWTELTRTTRERTALVTTLSRVRSSADTIMDRTEVNSDSRVGNSLPQACTKFIKIKTCNCKCD